MGSQSSRNGSGSASLPGHTYVETDGYIGKKIEHHKDGYGRYEIQDTDRPNDGYVREKMNGQTLREKPASSSSRAKIYQTYKDMSGSYCPITNNCQHASQRAYDAA